MKKVKLQVIITADAVVSDEGLLQNFEGIQTQVGANDPEVNQHYFDKSKMPTKDGVFIQIATLCHALVSNVIWGNRLGFGSKQKHLTIIERLLKEGMRNHELNNIKPTE
jgi:hypothetical protein